MLANAGFNVPASALKGDGTPMLPTQGIHEKCCPSESPIEKALSDLTPHDESIIVIPAQAGIHLDAVPIKSNGAMDDQPSAVVKRFRLDRLRR